MSIIYMPNTKNIINQHMEIRKEMMNDWHYTDIPVENFSVKNVSMLYFMVCLEPKSVSYGKGLGAFVYKDGRVFQFWYNIHTPHSKGPHLSNQMTNINELIWDVESGIGLIRNEHTRFADKAFWYYTPTDSLDEEGKTLRALMKSLQVYCRNQDYCKKLRKLDKAHEKWRAEKERGLYMTESVRLHTVNNEKEDIS